MRTEKEKMLAGEMYNSTDPVLLKELLGSTGENVYMEPNIRSDYGYKTYVGENLFCTL